MRLDQLVPGERFRTESGRSGSVVHVGDMGVRVVYDGKQAVEFESESFDWDQGQTVKTRHSFTRKQRAIIISGAAVVTKVVAR